MSLSACTLSGNSAVRCCPWRGSCVMFPLRTWRVGRLGCGWRCVWRSRLRRVYVRSRGSLDGCARLLWIPRLPPGLAPHVRHRRSPHCRRVVAVCECPTTLPPTPASPHAAQSPTREAGCHKLSAFANINHPWFPVYTFPPGPAPSTRPSTFVTSHRSCPPCHHFRSFNTPKASDTTDTLNTFRV